MLAGYWNLHAQIPSPFLFGGVALLHSEGSRHGLGSAVSDHNLGNWLIASVGGVRLDRLDHLQALDHLAEDDVASVQPASLLHRDEELASVGVLAGVGHRQPTGTVVLQLEVLILEAFAIDRAS